MATKLRSSKASKNNDTTNINYLETLRKCTKTVMDLYTKHVANFPKEYIALAVKTSVPNGTILRIPVEQNRDNLVFKIMRYKKADSELTDYQLLDLINAWVYLEKGQTPLNYLESYFKYIIQDLGITKYRLKQMFQELDLDEGDDRKTDPDYDPELDTEDYSEELEYTEDEELDIDEGESGDSSNLDTTEFEFKQPGEETDYEEDSDKSPDYVPSVESEDEYENTHRNVVVVSKMRKTRNSYKTIH
jgi:hypothetical protein